MAHIQNYHTAHRVDVYKRQIPHWSISSSQYFPLENTKVFHILNLQYQCLACICYYRSDYCGVYLLFDMFKYIPGLEYVFLRLVGFQCLPFPRQSLDHHICIYTL